MLSILSAIFGFLAPFIPEVSKTYQRHQDDKPELEMFRLRVEQAEKEHLYRMDEIGAMADINETVAIHRESPTTGIQLVDTVRQWTEGAWYSPIIMVPGFFIYALLDVLNTLVRPAVTYGMIFMYCLVKYGLYLEAMKNGMPLESTVQLLWSEDDLAVLTLVLSYWFGARSAKQFLKGKSIE